MVGREIDDIYPKRNKKTFGDTVLELRNWSAISSESGKKILKDINFHIRKGEVVALAGLMGAGRTEFATSIFGNPREYKISGELYINGQSKKFKHTSDAIKSGIAYVTEDRKKEGLILIQDIKNNITIGNISSLARGGIIDENEEINVANKYKDDLTIKAPSIEQLLENLSGGNQQKVSLGKWLFTQPDILILDEPTRGIDVGAKYEIYTIMNQLIDAGLSIIMISSELPEVLGMSDRIYVMAHGQITGELNIDNATQDLIMEMATA